MNRTITYPPQSPRPANGGYRYFFNGQEADNEVLGDGVSLTAEFWQYDSRLGRRWNVDPVFKEYESPFMNRWDGPSVVKDGYASALLKLSFIPADKLTTGGWMQTYSSNLPDDDTGNYDESLPSSTTLFERVDAQTVEYNKDPDFADYFRDPPSFTLEDIPARKMNEGCLYDVSMIMQSTLILNNRKSVSLRWGFVITGENSATSISPTIIKENTDFHNSAIDAVILRLDK